MFGQVKISTRIYGIAGVLLMVGAAIGGVGYVKMNSIGVEVAEIAEQDIPLDAVVTKITTAQLRQAILLEKGLAHLMAQDIETLGSRFQDLGRTVDEEIVQAEQLLSEAIDRSRSEEGRAKFQGLLDVLTSIQGAHHDYETYGETAFAALARGDKQGGGQTGDGRCGGRARGSHQKAGHHPE
ncbi:Tar ligand binding domain-containing protein [Rhodospirillum sp. A1_3_36]|uniref:Tar ligand binding domain-containing protein n=1 Tax=Rhodospirillum sp. A1_3_36 TaxID=3391666 RepID=UPI0039A526B6